LRACATWWICATRPSERYFFHPSIKGSSALKKVLPALMRSSHLIQDVSRQPSYGTAAMPSLKLAQPVAWWVQRAVEAFGPYEWLPLVFSDFGREELNVV
jgi:hypothetical protein